MKLKENTLLLIWLDPLGLGWGQTSDWPLSIWPNANGPPQRLEPEFWSHKFRCTWVGLKYFLHLCSKGCKQCFLHHTAPCVVPYTVLLYSTPVAHRNNLFSTCPSVSVANTPWAPLCAKHGAERWYKDEQKGVVICQIPEAQWWQSFHQFVIKWEKCNIVSFSWTTLYQF